jgi:eukaryotic-like serine/threonine-protein kinase
MKSRDTQPGAAASSQTARRKIGQYEVTAKLGEGGMGEVYRARDAKLGRDVALKILPAAMAHDSQLLARLGREARTLASLNHPNIAAIYGLEESEGLRALVMELVEGETLAEHLRGTGGAGKKPLSPDEALPIARQIAEALEYAHERGVIHRDLKPANVKITPEGTVKVLDFGLAKVLSDQDSATPTIPANSPTLSVMATQAGIILGTAAYMAPEQAKGKPVDRRADIWAFGCVLFEMLAGRRAFEGETISDLLAAVIRGEPEWTALPETTPPAIRKLIRRCLVKDPKQRLRDIGDARIAIEEIVSGADTEAGAGGGIPETRRASRLRSAVPWALCVAAVLFSASTVWLLFRPKPQQNVVRFTVAPPENADLVLGGETSISPDGRTLTFVAKPDPSKPQVLWLRALDTLVAQQIPGTDGASDPFWSPDGQQLGFEAGGKLEKIALPGGTPQTVCDANGFAGATWNRDGVILFSSSGGTLFRVSDTGGAPTLVLSPDPSRRETSDMYPQFLPDGRHFIFQALTTNVTNFVEAGSLDSKTVERLAPVESQVAFALPGYLFYENGRTLMARPFNARALSFTGPEVPIAQNIGITPFSRYAYFSVSPSGVLAYGSATAGLVNQIIWFNRAGEKLGTVGQTAVHTAPALSPDGTRFAVAEGEFGKRDIWIYDLKRGTASRLTFGPADNTNTTWSPDGTRIVFSSNQDGQYDIYQKAANGLGGSQPVFQSPGQAKHLDDLSADGRYAIYDAVGEVAELWGLPLFGDRKPFPFVRGNFFAASAGFSPNGRYVAYMSGETGNFEVYVQTFPQQTDKWQISAAGGLQPIWGRDGKELFYLALDGKLMEVDVNTNAATFQAGIPKPLFQTQLATTYQGRNMYVVSPDGQRFLVLVPVSGTEALPITVIANWPALLKK